MKIIFRTAALAALIITASCGKDDSPSGSEIDQIAEEQEQTPLETNLVADNVVISGSTKEAGTPPTPNEAISLDVSGASQTALLNEGFDIPFSSDGDVVGAYLQFKGNDGTISDSYYDINVSNNSTGKAISNKTRSKRRAFNHTAKVNEATLDVDFNAQIEPGTFCYVICVYDAQGNISAPQEVCVTVESWGGSADLISKWNLTKEEYIESTGEVDTDVVGVEECVTSSQECTDGGVIEYEECGLVEFAFINLNQNGTYNIEYKGGESYLDYNTSVSNCNAILKEYVYHEKSSGNWAYDADEQRLVLVEYSYIDEGTDGIGQETYPPGNGYVAYDGKVDLNGNILIIDEGDYKSYLEK